MMRALKLLFFASLAFSSTTAYADSLEWGTDADKVRKGTLGELWKEPIRYELRTQFATLHKSHVRLEIDWYDHWAKKEVKQVLFEDTRRARIDDYKIKLLVKKRRVTVTYRCPIDRKDKSTMCTEIWDWQKVSRRFALMETHSTNPVLESQDGVFKLIKEGKIKLAKKSIKTMRKRHGDASVDADAFFQAFFAQKADQVLAMHQNGKTKKAVIAFKDFLDSPPIVSAESCPDAEKFTMCLKGKRVCGCSDPHGDVAWSEANVKRLEGLVVMFAKAREHDLVVRFGKPVADKFNDRTRATLAVADSYWATESYDKARKYYTIVRKVRFAQKVFIPVRVFKRFNASDPK